MRWLIITKTRLFKIYWEFYHQQMKTFRWKNSGSFYISSHNIACRYLLEPPQRGSSNEYPQSVFFSINKKINVYPCKPVFYYIKVSLMARGGGAGEGKLYRRVFVMYTIIISISFCWSADMFSLCWAHTSRKHAYIMLTPLNPTFT